MNASRTVLIIKQQVFKSTGDIYFSYYDYLMSFMSDSRDYAFIIFEIIVKILLIYSMVLQNHLLGFVRLDIIIMYTTPVYISFIEYYINIYIYTYNIILECFNINIF